MSSPSYYLQMPELFQSHQLSFLVLFHDWLSEREKKRDCVQYHAQCHDNLLFTEKLLHS